MSWSKEGRISPVLLVGGQGNVEAIAATLPAEFRKRTAIIQKALPRIYTGDMKKEARIVAQELGTRI